LFAALHGVLQIGRARRDEIVRGRQVRVADGARHELLGAFPVARGELEQSALQVLARTTFAPLGPQFRQAAACARGDRDTAHQQEQPEKCQQRSGQRGLEQRMPGAHGDIPGSSSSRCASNAPPTSASATTTAGFTAPPARSG
jgi:hypothetical protein